MTDRQIERFKAAFSKGRPQDCWVWNLAKNNKGYGKFGTGKMSTDYAHRISFRLFREEIPNGLNVLHTCDNPPCVNPNHLFLGTQKDNGSDCRIKGRTSRGSGRPLSKLSEDQVIKIRNLHSEGARQIDLVKKFRVSKTTICIIVNKKAWKHI